MYRFQICTGSEYHSTEHRGAMVTVDGNPIYQVYKAETAEWSLVGNKGAHGKWCIAEYLLPENLEIVFKATANGKKPIVETFVVGQGIIDIDGYDYAGSPCGWIVSLA